MVISEESFAQYIDEYVIVYVQILHLKIYL